jgi:hypothetical protein
MHKPSLEVLICCASFVGGFWMLVWIVSPTLILVPVYLTNKNKKKQTMALPVEILGSLNFIIIIITFIFIIYYYYKYIIFYFILFYVFTQLCII